MKLVISMKIYHKGTARLLFLNKYKEVIIKYNFMY